MKPDGPVFEVRMEAPGNPKEVFPVVWGELSSSLLQRGWTIEGRKAGLLRPVDSSAPSGERAFVEEWRPPERISLAWRSPKGSEGPPSRLELRCAPHRGGTRVSILHRGASTFRGKPLEENRLGWFATEIVPQLLLATMPAKLVEWADDRGGRRPSGPSSSAFYKEPIYHLPGFRAILEGLKVRADDRYLEVGCGGGALLKEVLKSGCTAAAVDHSADMLKVAGDQNARAVRSGRLRLRYGDAAALPFPPSRFTCVVMSGVLPWLPNPSKAFEEMFRVLRPGGRISVLSGTPKMYGTPAAGPKRKGGVRLYTDGQLARFARDAGFAEVRVEHRDLRSYAREAGVPKNSLYLFEPEYGHILWALRPEARASATGWKRSG